MTISPIINHGRTRFRVNIQRGGFRKRLFFATRVEAEAFALATGGPVKFNEPPAFSRHARSA